MQASLSTHAQPVGGQGTLKSASLPLDVLDVVDIDQTVLNACVLSVGVAWAPLGGCAGAGLLHHLVDLLEREALGLGDQEVGVEEGARCRDRPRRRRRST